jgi:hypothetical protein
MIRRAAYEKLPHGLFLFYAGGHPEDAPFLQALTTTAHTLTTGQDEFRIIPYA